VDLNPSREHERCNYLIEDAVWSTAAAAYRSWKVMEFKIQIFQAWKVMELGLGSGKSWKIN